MTDLRVLERLERAVVGGAERSEADEHVRLRVLLHRVRHVLVDRNQDLLVAPVELLAVVAPAKIPSTSWNQPSTDKCRLTAIVKFSG